MGRTKEYLSLTNEIKDTVWQALTSDRIDPDSVALNLAILDKAEPTNQTIVYLGTIVATGVINVDELKPYKELYKMVRTLRNCEVFFPHNITGFLKAIKSEDPNLHTLGPLVVEDIKRLVEYKANLLMKEYYSVDTQ